MNSATLRKQRERRRARQGRAIFRFELEQDAFARFLIDRAGADPLRADDHNYLEAVAKRFWLMLIEANEQAHGVTSVTGPSGETCEK